MNISDKMRKRRRQFVPATKQDARKLTAEEREQLRRKAVLLYKRENPVPVISRKLEMRPGTVYRWIDNYLNGGPIKYRENKRGRPSLNKHKRTWDEWLQELRERNAMYEKKKPGVPEDLLLYRGKEFFDWCAELTGKSKYVYYCQIRKKLKDLGIAEYDGRLLRDKNFLKKQGGEIGWMKYRAFLLGKPFKKYSY
ncbi:helix-turn-helix domain-containing protein [Akkermansia sp.]|uniref:helix-turn-helix domain-containing protein n=1 Tax=Akkermansia sp. TaxID=1872421 RepID=UPI003991C6EB